MKLKTLKETYGNKANGQVSVRELKAEAIKWAIEHRNKMWNWTEDTWMDFFNLKEEDLK